MFHVTFFLGSESSVELSFPGAKVFALGNESSIIGPSAGAEISQQTQNETITKSKCIGKRYVSQQI